MKPKMYFVVFEDSPGVSPARYGTYTKSALMFLSMVYGAVRYHGGNSVIDSRLSLLDEDFVVFHSAESSLPDQLETFRRRLMNDHPNLSYMIIGARDES